MYFKIWVLKTFTVVHWPGGPCAKCEIVGSLFRVISNQDRTNLMNFSRISFLHHLVLVCSRNRLEHDLVSCEDIVTIKTKMNMTLVLV